MKAIKWCIFLLPAMSLVACGGEEDAGDAYGNFEAEEVIVSAETQGQILVFNAEEGDAVSTGEVIVHVDTTQLYLKKLQLESGRASLSSRIRTLRAQVRASQVQMDNLLREKERVIRLLEGGAATAKQKDDLEGQIALLEAQILATRSQESSVHAERETLEIQIKQVEDQLAKCAVRNPMDGIILTKYRKEGEVAAPGLAMYKMADLDKLILRAYVSGSQLSRVKVGEEVIVIYDGPEGIAETRGTVSWISSRAEFTPKNIQTREERVNLVYAMKVRVDNDGSLKIGMPGEIRF